MGVELGFVLLHLWFTDAQGCLRQMGQRRQVGPRAFLSMVRTAKIFIVTLRSRPMRACWTKSRSVCEKLLLHSCGSKGRLCRRKPLPKAVTCLFVPCHAAAAPCPGGFAALDCGHLCDLAMCILQPAKVAGAGAAGRPGRHSHM